MTLLEIFPSDTRHGFTPVVWPRDTHHDDSGRVIIGDVALTEIVDQYATPTLVLDEEDIRLRCRIYLVYGNAKTSSEIAAAVADPDRHRLAQRDRVARRALQTRERSPTRTPNREAHRARSDHREAAGWRSSSATRNYCRQAILPSPAQAAQAAQATVNVPRVPSTSTSVPSAISSTAAPAPNTAGILPARSRIAA